MQGLWCNDWVRGGGKVIPGHIVGEWGREAGKEREQIE